MVDSQRRTPVISEIGSLGPYTHRQPTSQKPFRGRGVLASYRSNRGSGKAQCQAVGADDYIEDGTPCQ